MTDLLKTGEIIKQLRKENGLNQSELARMLGLDVSTISSYERDIRNPSKTVMGKISRLFNVSVEYLMGFTNVQNLQEKDDIEEFKNILQRLESNGIEIETLMNMELKTVPLMGTVGAGGSIIAYEKVEDYLWMDFQADIALKVKGESMSPIIPDGSTVFVKHVNPNEFRNSELGVVRINSNEALLKYVYFYDSGVWLISENREYSPIFIDKNTWSAECELVGKVVETRIKY